MKTSNIPTYVFYFPYKGAGGVPVLFLRLAEYIADTYSVSSYVIDYNDGFMALNKKNPLIKLISFNEDKSIIVPDSSIIIFQSDLPWGITKHLQTNTATKVFFWNCYPFNLIPVFPSPIKEFTSCSLITTKIVLNTFLYFSKVKTKKLLKKMISNKALSFMDGPNLKTTEYCLSEKIHNPQFLPIIIKTPVNTFTNEIKLKKNDDVYTLCWIGRVADFKIHILNRVLEDCFIFSLENKIKIEFLVIGSGDEETNLFSPDDNHILFNIIKIPYLSESEINVLLSEKVDCLFAMGTSALEGAKLSIPTILLNFSYKKVKAGYKYNFLFEAENFSLGGIITKKDFEQGKDLKEILSLIKKDNLIGQKCFQYFLKNHTIENNFNSFLTQTMSSQLGYLDLISSTNLEKPFFYIIWKLIKKILAFRK